MRAINLSTLNVIERATRVVAALADPLQFSDGDMPRDKVVKVTASAKRLMKSLGHLIDADPRLKAVLGSYAIRPPVSCIKVGEEAAAAPAVDLDTQAVEDCEEDE